MLKKILSYTLFNRPILLLSFGFLLSSAFHFRTESIYEDALFTAIVDKINTEADSQPIESFFIHAMQMTHTLESNRAHTFNGRFIAGLKANIFRPATIDLMTGNGSCGSYATVLARILKAGGYQVRIAQMNVKGNAGGHMVVEAKKRSNWIVLDPMLQQYFKKPNGSLASFNDVHENWAYYKMQTRENYPSTYTYEGVRYTNWNKFPTLGKIAQFSLTLFSGEKAADEFSARSYLLRKYNLLFWLAVAGLSVCFLLLAISIYSRR